MDIPKISSTQLTGGALALAGVAALGTAAIVIHHNAKVKRRKATHHKSSRKNSHRSSGRKLKFGSKAYRRKYLKHGRRTPHTAGKRRDTSHRRIRYTSKGQPYIIGAHGKARFIKKSSAHLSYKRKGGKY